MKKSGYLTRATSQSRSLPYRDFHANQANHEVIGPQRIGGTRRAFELFLYIHMKGWYGLDYPESIFRLPISSRGALQYHGIPPSRYGGVNYGMHISRDTFLVRLFSYFNGSQAILGVNRQSRPCAVSKPQPSIREPIPESIFLDLFTLYHQSKLQWTTHHNTANETAIHFNLRNHFCFICKTQDGSVVHS